MNVDRMFRRHAEYYRKKWFPAQYPDPYGAFVDDVTEEAVKHLSAVPGHASAALLLVLRELLPRLLHREPATAAERIYLQSMEGGIRAADAMYHLRALPDGERMRLWDAWRQWAQQAKTPLTEWLSERTAVEHKLKGETKQALSRFAIDAEKECEGIDKMLRATRDVFANDLHRVGTGRSLADWLAVFRLQPFDTLGDWNDFGAFARGWAEMCHITTLPNLNRSQVSPAEQHCFPVDPPARVILRYGKAAGPVDLLRFLQELGRASFYCGMNPELSSTDRLLGDPQLPHFWSYLYAGALTHPAGIDKLIGAGADELAQRLGLVTRFWNRYDCMLALYHERLAPDMKEAQDLYVACWDLAFAIEPPHFLYLFDLERSGDALLRVTAFRSAVAVIERLRSLFGNAWFASERCAKRLRDYRHEGYRLKLADCLQDLDAVAADPFLISSS